MATLENLEETLVIIVLLITSTSLIIIGTWRYEVPILLSLTIIVLNLLVCGASHISGRREGLAEAGETYQSLVNLRPDSVLSLADVQEAELRNLKKAKRDLEQELNRDSQQHQVLQQLYMEAIVAQSKNAKLCLSGQALKVHKCATHLAEMRVAGDEDRIAVKYQKLERRRRISGL
jgi:hypothetical protein